MWRVRVLIAVYFILAGKSVAAAAPVPISIAPGLPGTGTGEPERGMFLVAKRALDGSHFGQSVVYLVEHDESGTLGLIVNRSSALSLSEAIPGIKDKQTRAQQLYYGGPVGLPVIFMLARSESASRGMMHVADDVYISSDREAFEKALATMEPGNEPRFYIGYSGWAAGQLDQELQRGSWHLLAADTNAIFSSKTDALWDRLIERLEPGGIQVDHRPASPIIAFATKPLLPMSMR